MSATVSLITNNATRLLKRPLLDQSALRTAMQDSSWADGLRGIASVYVVASHMVLCFARRLVFPCCGDDGHSVLLFQRPILRLVAQGQAWVALFLILSGFVNALKPVKLARAGNIESALSNLSVSSLRRPFRLALPAAAATVLSWFVCQLGAYETARNSDAYWLYTYTPAPSPSWGVAIEDLFIGLRNTWTFGIVNPYDQPQWALPYFLQGSMMVFTALLVTTNMTPTYRMLTLTGLAFWSFDLSYKFRDPLVGFAVFSGIILSEISLTNLPSKLGCFSLFLGIPIAILGLVLMSFPSDGPEQTQWTTFLLAFAKATFPKQIDYGRFYGTFGGVVLMAGIVMSPHLRALLSKPAITWLGKISFPIYLLHGTLMRSFFAWILFFNAVPIDVEMQGDDGAEYLIKRYPLPGHLHIAVSVLMFAAVLLGASHVWAAKVEPWFGWMTKKAEDRMKTPSENRVVLPLRKE